MQSIWSIPKLCRFLKELISFNIIDFSRDSSSDRGTIRGKSFCSDPFAVISCVLSTCQFIFNKMCLNYVKMAKVT